PMTATVIVPGPWPSRTMPPATALPPAAASASSLLVLMPVLVLLLLLVLLIHVSRFTFYASHFAFLVSYENLRLQHLAGAALHHSSTPALFHARAVASGRRPRLARLHSVQRLPAGRLGLPRHQCPRRTGGERSVPILRGGPRARILDNDWST